MSWPLLSSKWLSMTAPCYGHAQVNAAGFGCLLAWEHTSSMGDSWGPSDLKCRALAVPHAWCCICSCTRPSLILCQNIVLQRRLQAQKLQSCLMVGLEWLNTSLMHLLAQAGVSVCPVVRPQLRRWPPAMIPAWSSIWPRCPCKQLPWQLGPTKPPSRCHQASPWKLLSRTGEQRPVCTSRPTPSPTGTPPCVPAWQRGPALMWLWLLPGEAAACLLPPLCWGLCLAARRPGRLCGRGCCVS